MSGAVCQCFGVSGFVCTYPRQFSLLTNAEQSLAQPSAAFQAQLGRSQDMLWLGQIQFRIKTMEACLLFHHRKFSKKVCHLPREPRWQGENSERVGIPRQYGKQPLSTDVVETKR